MNSALPTKPIQYSLRKTMSNSSIAVLIIGITLSVISGCLRYQSNESTTRTSTPANSEAVISTPVMTEYASSKKTKASVTISSVAIYGWWWSDEQIAGNFDADNPPPKTSYVRLNM